MAKMTEDELTAIIASEESEAYGYYAGELATQRADALDRYNCLPYGDEVDGRSGAVSSDLRDTVEQITPQLLKVFLSGDEIVKFTPTGQNDEAQADQETDYCNYVILNRNNGFHILSTWFRDGLLQKNGYVKVWWECKQDVKQEEYEGLSDEQLAFIMQDQEVQVVSHETYPDPNPPPAPQAPPAPPQMGPDGPFVLHPPPPPPPPMLHSVHIRRVKGIEFVRVENVPPEELLVGKNTRTVCMQDAPFVQHRVKKSISEVRQMGFKIEDDAGDYDEGQADQSIQQQARNLYSEDQSEDNALDPAMRLVTFKETYLLADYDGDGVAELRKVCQVGNDVLEYDPKGKYGKSGRCNEETDHIPFACLTPIISPHRHVGVSVYDLLKYQQRYKTVAMRQTFDNAYLANNGRYAVDVNKVNLDDLLVSRPGGMVRVDGAPGEAVFPLTHPTNGQSGLQLIQYIDSWSEKSSGISAYGGNYQGIDQNALNKTATGVNQATSFQQLKIEAIARTFAETGVRDLFLLIQALSLKHATKAEIVKIRNQWMPVDPRTWTKRYDMTVAVGLGTGSKEQQTGNMMQVLQLQEKAMQLGLTDPSKIFNSLSKLTQSMGYRNPQTFWHNPGPQMPPPPPNPVVQAEQIKAQTAIQVEQAKLQAHGQIEQAKAQQQTQLEQVKMAAARDKEMAQMQADLQTKQQASQFDYQLQLEKAKMELALDAQKHDQTQQSAIEIARIKAAAQVESARVSAGIGAGAQMVNAELSASETPEGADPVEAKPDPHADAMKAHTDAMLALHKALMAPKEIVRGPDGKAMGVRTLQ